MRHAHAAAPVAGSYELALQAAISRFGFSSLSPEQDTLIRASIEGFDTLGVLPTSGGKSACFQIPGVVTGTKTLVISPLIALQDDQVQALRKLGIKTFALHSGLDDVRKLAVRYYFKTASAGEPSFLYVSPELLMSENFVSFFESAGFDRLAVDEAHCVSTWGNSFRPDYQRIRLAVQRLRISQCSAFTATVDSRIEADIRKRLPLKPDFIKVVGSPERSNLILKIERAFVDDQEQVSGSKKLGRVFQLLEKPGFKGATIIYCGSKSMTTSLYLRLRKFEFILRKKGYSTYLFHAGLPYEDKEKALNGFREDPYPIVVATSAFGMGINRADVRQVIHYTTPYTLVDYAQQFGRAGRDGLPALCTTFHTRSDFLERELKKIEYDVPDIEFVELVHGWLQARLAKIPLKERRKYNLQKFLHHSTHVVMNSSRITHKESYLARVSTSVALLQKSGVIREDGDGFSVFALQHDSQLFLKLLEKTKMHERMEIREKRRLMEFFESPDPTQQLLWQILHRQ